MKKTQHAPAVQAGVIIIVFLLAFMLSYLVGTQSSVPRFIGAALVETRASIQALPINNTCTIPLQQNWNFIAIACKNASNTSIQNRLSSVSSTYLSIHTYQSSNAADPWKAFKPGLPSYVVVDLVNHSLTNGYWLRMNSSGTLATTGVTEIPVFIPFTAGYSMFGHTGNTTTVAEFLVNNAGEYTQVWTYNASSNSWYVYRITGSSNLTHIVPNQGYWINGTTSGVIVGT